MAWSEKEGEDRSWDVFCFSSFSSFFFSRSAKAHLTKVEARMIVGVSFVAAVVLFVAAVVSFVVAVVSFVVAVVSFVAVFSFVVAVGVVVAWRGWAEEVRPVEVA